MALNIVALLFLLQLWTVFCSQDDVSVMFMGEALVNGTSKVCLRHIGEQPSKPHLPTDTVQGPALVCVTTNPTCCRTLDGGGGVGHWTLNGVLAKGGSVTPLPLIYRNRGTGLVRLNVRTGAVVTGQFCCTLPDIANITRRLCVEVTLEKSVCNPPSPTTTILTTPNTTPPNATPSFTTTPSTTQAVRVTTSEAVTNTSNVEGSTSPPSEGVLDSSVIVTLSVVVVVCVSVVCLLLSIIILLYLKLSRQSHASSTVTDTRPPLTTDNVAYGKADQLPPLEDTVYECISDTLPPPTVTLPPTVYTRTDSSSSSEHYYY